MSINSGNGGIVEEGMLAKSISTIKKSGVKAFIKKGVKFILRKFEWMRILFYPYANANVASAAKRNYNSVEAVDFAMKKYGGFIRPSQVLSEIRQLAKLVEDLNPATILEIGTSRGGTLFIFSRLAQKNALIVSLDMPNGEMGGAYPHWKEPFYRKFASEGQKIVLLRGDSHSPEALTDVTNALSGKKVDFLFIDGDHSYDGVKKDYEMYSPLVRSGGIIAFHDIAKHPAITRSEVDLFWNEVKEGRDSREVIENKDQNWAGIGVIFVK